MKGILLGIVEWENQHADKNRKLISISVHRNMYG